MIDLWYTDYNVSKQHMSKLIEFYMAHQELSLVLLEAKPLGTCRITTSVGNRIKLNNHIRRALTLSKLNTKSSTPSNVDLKEMSC